MLAAASRLDGPLQNVAAAALAPFKLAVRDLNIPNLRRPQFGEADRPASVRASELHLSEPEPDDLGREGRLKRTISFNLPRGAYATVVLRSLGQ